MRWGEQEAWLREAHEGGPLPKALREKPRLAAALAFYWRAFFDLTSDRQVFMGGVSRIPYLAIDRWAERQGVAGDAFERLKAMIRAMDAVWIEDVAERNKTVKR